jgi:hypothetical protein
MAGKPIFVKPLPFTVSAYGNQLTSNPASSLGEFQYPGVTWKSSGNTNLYVVVDLGAAQTVDFVAMLASNALAGTAFTITMDTTSAGAIGGSPAYSSGAQTFISPATTGRALYNSYFAFPSAQTYRYLAIQITGHTGDFEASFLVIGTQISVTRYYETQWESCVLDLSQVTDNRNGVSELAYGAVWRQLQFTLGWLTESEWETSILPLLLACGKTEPLYCCFDPDPTTYRQNRTYFGRLAEATVRKMGFNQFQKEFQIKSFI